MPPRIKTLIGELGLRYRPSSTADLNEHFAMIALLAVDVADIPPKYLDGAISAWVRSPKGRFMPKASELIELAQSLLKAAEPQSQASGLHCNTPQASCDRNNTKLDAGGPGPRNARWITDDRNCWIEPVSNLEETYEGWRLKPAVKLT